LDDRQQLLFFGFLAVMLFYEDWWRVVSKSSHYQTCLISESAGIPFI
jgi:hypothetical protein